MYPSSTPSDDGRSGFETCRNLIVKLSTLTTSVADSDERNKLMEECARAYVDVCIEEARDNTQKTYRWTNHQTILLTLGVDESLLPTVMGEVITEFGRRMVEQERRQSSAGHIVDPDRSVRDGAWEILGKNTLN